MNRKAMAVLVAAVLLPVVLLSACGTPKGPAIQVQDVWARPALSGAGMDTAGSSEGSSAMGEMAGSTGAVFMLLVYRGGEADRLVGATTAVAQTVEIHETVMQGDVMKMQMLPAGLEVPARARVELKPGGYHLMLIGLNQDLNAGDRFRVELQFEKSGFLTVEPEVRQP